MFYKISYGSRPKLGAFLVDNAGRHIEVPSGVITFRAPAAIGKTQICLWPASVDYCPPILIGGPHERIDLDRTTAIGKTQLFSEPPTYEYCPPILIGGGRLVLQGDRKGRA